jgi:hypothetical protein
LFTFENGSELGHESGFLQGWNENRPSDCNLNKKILI